MFSLSCLGQDQKVGAQTGSMEEENEEMQKGQHVSFSQGEVAELETSVDFHTFCPTEPMLGLYKRSKGKCMLLHMELPIQRLECQSMEQVMFLL